LRILVTLKHQKKETMLCEHLEKSRNTYLAHQVLTAHLFENFQGLGKLFPRVPGAHTEACTRQNKGCGGKAHHHHSQLNNSKELRELAGIISSAHPSFEALPRKRSDFGRIV
jgi:hypothetical protein